MVPPEFFCKKNPVGSADRVFVLLRVTLDYEQPASTFAVTQIITTTTIVRLKIIERFAFRAFLIVFYVERRYNP
jgi:hypothetical protein